MCPCLLAIFILSINNYMTHNFKYAYNAKPDYPGKRGPKSGPNIWRYPTPWQHDCHMALLKHRAQAKFRGEAHTITESEWMNLWTEDLWNSRGKHSDAICLSRIDDGAAWAIGNLHFITRRESIQKTIASRLANDQ